MLWSPVSKAGGSGRSLTAFVSANGRAWQQTRPLGTSASQAVGRGAGPGRHRGHGGYQRGPDSRQPVLTLAGPDAAADHVDIAGIPGAVDAELAVNSLAAQASMQVAVGSANGFPAAWTSVDGGSSWTVPPAPPRGCSTGRDRSS